jgi:hypothetical protein
MASVVLRDASDDELAAIFRAQAENIVATVDGEPVAYVRFQTIEGRRWGVLNMLSGVAPSVVPAVFYALRRRLVEEAEPIYALCEGSARAARLLRLVGLSPTGETSAGKEVWRWMPGR